MTRTFKKALQDGEYDKTSYIDIEEGCYSETIIDDGSGYPEPGGWYEMTEPEDQFVKKLIEMGYEEL